jgi:hypothetical protein
MQNLSHKELLAETYSKAKFKMSPTLNASDFINNLSGNTLDANQILESLIELSQSYHSDELKKLESILLMQTKALDALFYDALRKFNDANMINQVQIFADIAFKSQSECRKTIRALSELKNPKRTTFIKQQNNAVNQQVNNKKS